MIKLVIVAGFMISCGPNADIQPEPMDGGQDYLPSTVTVGLPSGGGGGRSPGECQLANCNAPLDKRVTFSLPAEDSLNRR